MFTENRTKINKLISVWPKGAVYTAEYLKRLGYNYDLVHTYKMNKWIETVGNGAYKLYNDHVDWLGGVYALQTQVGLNVHIGGKTALLLKGYSHNAIKKSTVSFLFGTRGIKLPLWFKNYNWDTTTRYVTTNLFPDKLTNSFSRYNHRDLSIRISAPERAIMEMLYHVPKEQGFDEVQKIMETLFTLRPNIVQELLENCNSIKVKRLFMYMAEKLSFPWAAELDVSKLDFGSGERSVVANGVWDKKYRITVPREREE